MTSRTGTRTDYRLATRAAAIASLGAAVIHFAVTPEHWRDWLPSGLFFASIQQWPMWPGTGHPSEQTAANVVNAVSPQGAPPAVWRRAFESLMPAVDAFAPDLILISAGFDAHVRDPLGGGGQALEAEDFAWATRAITSVANRHAKGRVVSSLEGGYDLQALGRSAVAHVRALQEG